MTIVSFSEEVHWKRKKGLKLSYQDTDKEGGELWEGVGQRVQDGLLEVVEDEPALLDASDDGGKVVVLLSMLKNFFFVNWCSNESPFNYLLSPKFWCC